jgi:ornithine cyclodeaminase/alanine dehydrogenase-like protein (mu-crystallin family)
VSRSAISITAAYGNPDPVADRRQRRNGPDGTRLYTRAMTDTPPLRYLSGADVAAAMPPLPDRLALAELALRGLAAGAELPPKIGVHPRAVASFAHAMPALLHGADADGSADLLGMKWVSGNPANNAAGIAGIHGLLVLNDPVTTVPIAILDAGPITAERTAATSGVSIRAFAPSIPGTPLVALVGAGVQGRSHVPVIGHLLPGLDLVVFDPDPMRAAALADLARGTAGIGSARAARTAREAVQGADVVVTVAAFVPPPERQVMTNDWLAPHALVVPVDYATYCAAEVPRDADLFLVDHTAQFLANREVGNFDGYPEPAGMIGAALGWGAARPAGRVVTTHLGTGLADVVFGSEILATATRLGLGTILPR